MFKIVIEEARDSWGVTLREVRDGEEFDLMSDDTSTDEGLRDLKEAALHFLEYAWKTGLDVLEGFYLAVANRAIYSEVARCERDWEPKFPDPAALSEFLTRAIGRWAMPVHAGHAVDRRPESVIPCENNPGCEILVAGNGTRLHSTSM